MELNLMAALIKFETWIKSDKASTVYSRGFAALKAGPEIELNP
jgi:hypothetical protein